MTPLTSSPRNTTVEIGGGIANALNWLHDQQDPEGFWMGALESNSCMEAEWILAMHVLGVHDDPKLPGVVRAILDKQRDDGSWEIYHNAEGGDINTTVECYAALRAAGEDPDSPPLKLARDWIHRHGGMSRLRNFTKYWMALIGEWPWNETPTLPPELIYLPPWMPFNIYQFATWARGTIIPLTILSARRTTRPLPPDRRLDELFPEGRAHHDHRLQRKHRWISWEGPFYLADRLLRWYSRLPIRPGREAAIRTCLEWIIKHQEADGSWSGIQPPWIYSLMALHEEGYELDHPVVKAGLEAFNTYWSYQRNGATYLQASESTVWDTALTLQAMLDCGETPDQNPAMAASVRWLLDHQVSYLGDWHVLSKGLGSGGWTFQRANRNYPDIDDTAVVLLDLNRVRSVTKGPTPELDEAIRKGTEWVLGLQCSNGGWAAYDRDNTHAWLTKIPFSDFGELIDPPSSDVTAHVVEALAAEGRTLDDPAVAQAVRFLRDEQEEDGSWFGRWGVNHVYGTGAVLPALQAIGLDTRAPWIRRGAEWLVSRQNSDGGWGESCASYMDPALRGVGPSTASQTGWALMGLLAVDTHDFDESIRKGVQYLLDHQVEGTWNELEYTATGFPGYGVGHRVDLQNVAGSLEQDKALQRAFMLNYNMYRHYFPLSALGRARRHLAQVRKDPAHHQFAGTHWQQADNDTSSSQVGSTATWSQAN